LIKGVKPSYSGAVRVQSLSGIKKMVILYIRIFLLAQE
jgi:hypothetical protein